MAKKMKWYDAASYILLVVGGLNWGLVSFLNFNLVEWLSGLTADFVGTFIYLLVFVSAVYGGYMFAKLAK